MGKLIVSSFVSLDGFTEAPNRELVPPQLSPDLFRWFIRPNMERGGIFIYGRVTYEFMVGYWTSSAAEPKQAEELAVARKVVFSRTLKKADWGNVTIAHGDDLAAEVAAMKRETDGDLTILGSASLANAFMRAGLVEEWHILVNPIVLGAGTPLFQGGYARFGLKLDSARAFDSGSVLLRYVAP